MAVTEIEEIVFRLKAIQRGIEQIPFNSVEQELICSSIYEEIKQIHETLEEDEAFKTEIVSPTKLVTSDKPTTKMDVKNK